MFLGVSTELFTPRLAGRDKRLIQRRETLGGAKNFNCLKIYPIKLVFCNKKKAGNVPLRNKLSLFNGPAGHSNYFPLPASNPSVWSEL